MIIITVLVALYLFVGLAYALYILFNGIDPWYVFPLNLILGPITLLYNYYKFNIKKELPR